MYGLKRFLVSEYAAAYGLAEVDFLLALAQIGFDGDAAIPPAGQRADCQAILTVCLPYLQTLSPEPPEGWLAFFYNELTYGMYPDAAHPAPSPETMQAAAFYLCVLRYAIRREQCPFDPLSDIDSATEEEICQSRVEKEYRRFQKAVDTSHFVELMRIGRAIMPFDPASHTIGVHHVAIHMARQARRAGIDADIALVSAAALSHDIGKFGCRGENAKRIPFLHYYYTWQWLEEQKVPTIANVAANHSTWDLEFENLPVESLLLIYADFRVRGLRDETGKEQVKIYSLATAYDLIFSKLSQVTPEKQKRYQTVYAKLHDFEEFLCANGIDTDPVVDGPCIPAPVRAALLRHGAAPKALRDQTFANNIRLMRQISFDASFEQLLEQARNEKNLHSIRTYLHLYSEYHTYLSRAQKGKLLNFLYELLMHHDGDVRRRAARMMGQILSNSGPKYRKELPAGVPEAAAAPNLLSFLNESVQVWASYVEMLLHPDLKIAPKHAQRIRNSLKVVAVSVFESFGQDKWAEYLDVLLKQLEQADPADYFVLIDTFTNLPTQVFPPETAKALVLRLQALLVDGSEAEKIIILCFFRKLQQRKDAWLNGLIAQAVETLDPADSTSVTYEKSVVLTGTGLRTNLTPTQHQHLYLSNMEAAVHWAVKIIHIDILCDSAAAHPQEAFHTAMHLSNLICVSEHLPVRVYAGNRLTELSAALPTDQKNELVINLIRELETGRDEVSRFIPRHLGQMLCQLPRHEFGECLQLLEDLVRSNNTRAAMAALSTLGYLLTAMHGSDNAIAERVFGLLMVGVSHNADEVHQVAMSTLCRGIFDEQTLALPVRQKYFRRICKKLLTLLEEPHPGQLNFFTRAAALNHLYRFMVQCRVDLPEPPEMPERPIAFFPGTFDPFSSGHKRIVQEICSRGFDVYLAIDEFSWSKQTLPKLLRRQIASISVADQLDVFLFPDDIPVNIAMAEDLNRLRTQLPNRQVYLAVGSDVIRNASAYRDCSPGSASEFDHIVFYREEQEEQSGLVQQKIRGKLLALKLPPFFESVSSTRIREYVDKNLDISMLVDPIVQNLIYQRGLYLRSPLYKEVLAPHKLYYTATQTLQPEVPPQLAQQLAGWRHVASVVLRNRNTGQALGWACGHRVLTSQLMDALGDLETAALVRKRVSGSILMIDGAAALEEHEDIERMLLNELLARTQEQGYTYALVRHDPRLEPALTELGFLPMAERPELWLVDMRSPMVLIQDALQNLKNPHRSNPKVIAVVNRARVRLRRTFAQMFPGSLLLSFNTELLNHALRDRVQRCNGVDTVPEGVRQLGEKMCVPFGKILANELVPNTVTKRLEAEKEFTPDLRNFVIREYSGYSTLPNQVRTIKSFRRPVILVDDLMHNGYRIERLDPILKQEQLDVDRIIVGIMSGQGKDRMQAQGRTVECEYFVPNARYWQTESLLYPFIGGDSVKTNRKTEMLPTVNLVLPYQYPQFFTDASEQAIYRMSQTVLQNALEILQVLEKEHLATFGKTLTLKRLGEAIVRPRMPDRGGHLEYNLNVAASCYVQDDLTALCRAHRREPEE